MFHFILLDPALGRNQMVSSLCFQCVTALQGNNKLGTSGDAEEMRYQPSMWGEMSPVWRSPYQTDMYHGLTYKSHDKVKKPHVSFIFILHYSFGKNSLFFSISSSKLLVIGFFLFPYFGFILFFVEQLDFVVSLTESKVSSFRLKYQQCWREGNGYFTWLRLCYIEPQGHLNQPSASLGTEVIFYMVFFEFLGQGHVQTESPDIAQKLPPVWYETFLMYVNKLALLAFTFLSLQSFCVDSPRNVSSTSRDPNWDIKYQMLKWATSGPIQFLHTGDPVPLNKHAGLLQTVGLEGFGHRHFQIPLKSAAANRSCGNISQNAVMLSFLFVSFWKSLYVLHL